jgi:hypothetical protein
MGVELDDLNWLEVVMPVEEKQLDGAGIPGEDREIHAILIDRGTEWVGSAGLCLEWNKGCRFANIGFLLADGSGAPWHGKVSGQDGNEPLTRAVCSVRSGGRWFACQTCRPGGQCYRVHSIGLPGAVQPNFPR